MRVRMCVQPYQQHLSATSVCHLCLLFPMSLYLLALSALRGSPEYQLINRRAELNGTLR